MSTPIKKKLCWNCEGNVSRQADNCPYCGVYLHREQDEEDFDDDEEDLSPPYQPEQVSKQDDAIPHPPYTAQSTPVAEPKTPYIQQAANPWLSLSADWKQVVFPIVFLLSGSIFLLFGLLLFLFSHNGVLTLSWNADTWFVYLVAAVPLLYFGWRALQKLGDTTEAP